MKRFWPFGREKRLHWYLFTCQTTKVDEYKSTTTFVTLPCGFLSKNITDAGIKSAQERITEKSGVNCVDSTILMVAYLGYMTEKEFTRQ